MRKPPDKGRHQRMGYERDTLALAQLTGIAGVAAVCEELSSTGLLDQSAINRIRQRMLDTLQLPGAPEAAIEAISSSIKSMFKRIDTEIVRH